MQRLTLFIILLYGATLQASCFSKLDEIIARRLNQELRLEKGNLFEIPDQRVVFNHLNFSKEEEALVADEIESVNDIIRLSNKLELPSSISTSCGIDVKNGCLNFHHLYFDVESSL